jgi:[FeFe] hydrogenase H-cluster maturation GTPase HydF
MRQEIPKSLRLHIGIFGRTNVGKSSVLNYIAGQDVSITSPHRGTTTDTVDKTMELLPLGPVVFIDTAGLDDTSLLSELRIKRTKLAYERSDIFILITEPGIWGKFEEHVVKEARQRKAPVVAIINKIDSKKPGQEFLKTVEGKVDGVFPVSAVSQDGREEFLKAFKNSLIELAPANYFAPPKMFEGILKKGDVVVFVIPIDSQAPKGRIILPQVQAIRESLDDDIISVVTNEKTLSDVFVKLKEPPQLVVCDSQAVALVDEKTPKTSQLTTYSMILSMQKGALKDSLEGAKAIKNLKKTDKILIAEACSHHPLKEDIGRIKIPKWLEEYLGYKVAVDVCAGRDFPENISSYALIIHCGACMINERAMLSRLEAARKAGVPITNYGVCISYLKGVLERTSKPLSR